VHDLAGTPGTASKQPQMISRLILTFRRAKGIAALCQRCSHLLQQVSTGGLDGPRPPWTGERKKSRMTSSIN
jgi:hypothetical protein